MLTLQQKKEFLRSKGIAFANNANETRIDEIASQNSIVWADTADTAENNADNTAVNLADLLEKFVKDNNAFDANSEEAQKLLDKAIAEEYPDYGRDLKEGYYTCTGQMTVKKWFNKKNGTTSQIMCAVVVSETNKPELIPFSCFCPPQYEYLEVRKTDDGFAYAEIEVKTRLNDRQPTTATRNKAVATEIVGKPRVYLHHTVGHPNNPNAKRIWDRTLTWIE